MAALSSPTLNPGTLRLSEIEEKTKSNLPTTYYPVSNMSFMTLPSLAGNVSVFYGLRAAL